MTECKVSTPPECSREFGVHVKLKSEHRSLSAQWKQLQKHGSLLGVISWQRKLSST